MSKLALLGGRYLLGLSIAQGGERVEVDVAWRRASRPSTSGHTSCFRGTASGTATSCRTRSTTPRTCGRSRARLQPGPGDRLRRLASRGLRGRLAASAPTTSSPSGRAPDVRRRARAHRRPVRRALAQARAPRWREWGDAEPPRRGRLLAVRRPAPRDAGRDQADRQDADVVGMTLASECIVACELHMLYAAVCVVDNLANGIAVATAHDRAPRGGPRRERGAPRRRALAR